MISYWFDWEVKYAYNGVARIFLEPPLYELVQEARLPSSGRPDHQELEQVIVGVVKVRRWLIHFGGVDVDEVAAIRVPDPFQRLERRLAERRKAFLPSHCCQNVAQ